MIATDTIAGPPREVLASIGRSIALADDKLSALRDAAREASDCVRRGLVIKQEAVDALFCIACAHDLPGLVGDDVVQRALAEGFGDQP